MGTIELRYHTDDETQDDICITFDSESMTIYDLADRFQRFALAIGYLPGSVERVFKDYNDESDNYRYSLD